MGSEITVRVTGRFTWENMFDLNMQGKTGSITQRYHTKEVRKFFNDEFKTNLKEKTKETKNVVAGKVTAGAEYQGMGATTEVSNSKETSVSDFVSRFTRSQTTVDETKETERYQEFVVAGGDHLVVYQEMFVCEGVKYSTGRISTQNEPDRELSILIKMERLEFIGGIDVCYGSHASDAPDDRIRCYDGQNDDVNAGQGGDYVWLVPSYTYDINEALTSIDVFHQGDSDDSLKDLAKGAGGDFRYAKGVRDRRIQKKITKAYLVRNGDDQPELEDVPGAWGKSNDINHKRSGDYLHLLWV